MTDSSEKIQGEFAFDSDRQYLGEVYAKALLGAAGADQAAAVVEQLESLVHDVLAVQPRLRAVWLSPKIPFAEKEALLEKAFGQGENAMHPALMKFLKVCMRRGRMDCLRQIVTSARNLLNESLGRVRVRVKSAAPLDDGIRGEILAKLEQALGMAVDIQTEVDPSLLGGLLVRVGDTVYDGSVAHRLRRMRKEAVAKAAETFRASLDHFASENGA